jgi:hypothetical protein
MLSFRGGTSVITHAWAEWVNRIGLIVGFFSFWFAAPELIGEQRLKSWETAIAPSVQSLRWTLLAALAVTPLLLFGIWTYTCIRERHLVEPPFWYALLFFISTVGAPLLDRYLDRLVTKLANDSHARQTALFIGAVLFTLSFAFQLAGTLPQIPAGTGARGEQKQETHIP